jgi:hypothetical protein
MPMICHECGEQGHYSRECPHKQGLAEDASQASRPRWCGLCDRRSRHVDLPDGRVKRCTCHPESHLQLKHHRKCPHCRKTVVEWDSSIDCEHHILAGEVKPYVGPGVREPEPDKRSKAALQVAESRATREESEEGIPRLGDFIGTGHRPAEYPA